MFSNRSRSARLLRAGAVHADRNLLLHGISAPESPSLITVDDSLRSAPGEHFDMVLTNPPFGRKSSYKVINAQRDAEREDMSYLREDFWATTSNKQQCDVHTLMRLPTGIFTRAA
jgi:type I restriction-modification system DNA methylase subunit